MKILYSDLDIRFMVERTEFRALNIIYERLSRRKKEKYAENKKDLQLPAGSIAG